MSFQAWSVKGETYIFDDDWNLLLLLHLHLEVLLELHHLLQDVPVHQILNKKGKKLIKKSSKLWNDWIGHLFALSWLPILCSKPSTLRPEIISEIIIIKFKVDKDEDNEANKE